MVKKREMVQMINEGFSDNKSVDAWPCAEHFMNTLLVFTLNTVPHCGH